MFQIFSKISPPYPQPPYPPLEQPPAPFIKGEGDWGRGVVYKVAKWQEGKEARGQRTISPVTKPYLIGFRI
jgi:hypothetical protein